MARFRYSAPVRITRKSSSRIIGRGLLITLPSRIGRSRYTLILIGSTSALLYLVLVLLAPLPQWGSLGTPTDLGGITRPEPWKAVVWVSTVVVLFGLYGAAFYRVGKVPLPPGWVVGFGLVFGLILIWLYPVTATDLFQYVMRARVGAVHGANPLAVPPSTFPNDPLLPFTGVWRDSVSPYGPAWEVLAGSVARLGFTGAVSGALAYKGVAFLAYAVCIVLLAVAQRSPAQPYGNGRALLFFAWNPLVLIQGIGNGHNDLVMLAWLLLGLVVGLPAVHRVRPAAGGRSGAWAFAAAALSLSVLTKAAAVLLVPLWWVATLRDQPTRTRRVGVTVGAAAIAVGMTLLVFVPFWPPWQNIGGLQAELANNYLFTITGTLRIGLETVLHENVLWPSLRLTGQVLFGVLFIWLLRQVWRGRLDVASAGFLAFFAYLVTGGNFRLWYPMWLVPLAALSPAPAAHHRTVLFCLVTELSVVILYFAWQWLVPGTNLLALHLVLIPWQFGVPLLLPLVWRSHTPRART